ncbi:MAG: excalibur calcium-binding domain-containing protein [Pseudomonadota bacterium]
MRFIRAHRKAPGRKGSGGRFTPSYVRFAANDSRGTRHWDWNRAAVLAEMAFVLPVLLALCLVGAAWFSSWQLSTALKHVFAAPDCAAARLVGLAPSARGEPGYDPQRDGDGWACDAPAAHSEVPNGATSTADER